MEVAVYNSQCLQRRPSLFPVQHAYLGICLDHIADIRSRRPPMSLADKSYLQVFVQLTQVCHGPYV